MNDDADPGLEEHLRIVKEVGKMRRAGMYLVLSFAVFGALAFCAFGVWVSMDMWLLALLFVGFCLSFFIVSAQFAPLACPSCRHPLLPSGRFSIGSLDKARCVACDVSFELDKR